MLPGPAGTGKTRGVLEKLNACALKYPGMRGLMVRKTAKALTTAALVTFEEKVNPWIHGVKFFGGNSHEAASYKYPNGSRIVVGGLDDPQKVMSTEYDMAYVQEATEIGEPAWEAVGARLRNGVMPYQQLIGDCNPDAPTHWILQRAARKDLTLLESRYEDNPLYWDARANDWTQAGRDYVLGRLERLTGVRYKRLRLGLWVAAEGMIYDGWDQAVHLVKDFPIPPSWPRYWGVDFGFTNPFALQWWAEDPDGRLYLYRELYHSQMLVEDAAKLALRLSGAVFKGVGNVQWPAGAEPKPSAIICDHDAEGRVTLERYLGMMTTPAYKGVADGIQAVASRLKPAGDGRPRFFVFDDAVVSRDPELVEAGKPIGWKEEVNSYVWDIRAGQKKGDVPLKQDDHSMDTGRYVIAYVDGIDKASRSFTPAAGGNRPLVGAMPAAMPGATRIRYTPR